MAAAVDDPAAPTIYRVSGAPPFPDPAFPSLPPDIVPRQVTLRDRQTVATIVPVSSRHQVPRTLLAYLCAQFNKEIEGGDTYPFIETFTVDSFADYWFQNFGGVMLLGDASVLLEEQEDWTRACLGSFFIKPNYPGRSSHVCNGGLLVTDASRNRGVGRLMGESYIDWAPRLGYTYSVFNCVYETNVASCKIWDALGFKRIGRVKGCGNLKSHPDRFVDGIIYGRDLSPSDDAEGLVTEERFDKIKFYLKFNKYPAGADRAEKSRLRSAATHYKLLDGDRLMLKDKEVISDPERQYEIARQVHMASHAGINKTTATIAEKYHWSRIKETVSDAIRACAKCKEGGTASKQPVTTVPSSRTQQQPQQQQPQQQPMSQMPPPTTTAPQQQQPQQQQQTTASVLDDLQMLPAGSYANLSDLSALQHHHHQLLHGSNDAVYQPIDPQIIDASHHHFDAYHSHADFQALLTATEDVPGGGDSSAVDRDLEMLIEQHQDHDMVADEQGDDDQDMHGKDRGLYDVTFGGGGGGGNH